MDPETKEARQDELPEKRHQLLMASPHVIDLGEALKDMIKISRLYTRVEFVQGYPASQSSEQAQYLHSVGFLRKRC